MSEGTFVWLEHPETGGKAQFAAGAVETWEAMGWVRCDPPPVVDLAIAHWPRPAEPAATPTSSPTLPSKPGKKPAKTATNGENQEAEHG